MYTVHMMYMYMYYCVCIYIFLKGFGMPLDDFDSGLSMYSKRVVQQVQAKHLLT